MLDKGLRLRRFRILLFLLTGFAAAQTAPPAAPARAVRTPLPLKSPVQDKNFYLLSLFERDPAVRKAIEANPALKAIRDSKREALSNAVRTCGTTPACYVEPMRFTAGEARSAGEALQALYQVNASLRALVDGPARRSGMFQLHDNKPGDALLLAAWSDTVRGLNGVIETYGLGQPPRYPAIDSAVYDVTVAPYLRIVTLIANVLQDQESDLPLFFQIPLRAGLRLMDANGRDEAGRHEPMDRGENKAAHLRVQTIRWADYPYSVIVVPGSGGDRPGVALSAVGKLRNEIAAKRYRERKAPFILVSGGYVHPNQTPFAEAIEMKKSLIADFGIPEDAILIDPHARHTTTNMRNAARIIYRYGIPFHKKALVTTDASQSASIESPGFAARCAKELGYAPHQILKRLTPFDLEFLPRIESLHANAVEPLDP